MTLNAINLVAQTPIAPSTSLEAPEDPHPTKDEKNMTSSLVTEEIQFILRKIFTCSTVL